MLAVVAVLVGVVVVVPLAFNFLRDADANRLLVVGVAIVVGVGGVFLLFWAMNSIVNWLPGRWREGVRPYVFVGPALVTLSVFLIYPVINTILTSFKDANGQSFVGLANYRFVFTDESMLRSIRNTAGWVVLVPLVAVSIGLVFATLADRLTRGESVAKSIIFLPMAISFVGAAVTFRLIYSYRPEGFGSNIGLLNGIKQGLGQHPVAVAVGATVEQPAAHGRDDLDADRLRDGRVVGGHQGDPRGHHRGGAHRRRVGDAGVLAHHRAEHPSDDRRGDDLHGHQRAQGLRHRVRHGQPEANGTEVIAERMIRWFFISGHDGRGAAIAVVLFLAVIPVMIWNVRRFREQEFMR